VSKELFQLQLSSSTTDATASLLDRVRRFLPEIQAANKAVDESDTMELPDDVSADQLAIDMNLLVGVFDAKEKVDVQARSDQFLRLERSTRRCSGIQEVNALQ